MKTKHTETVYVTLTNAEITEAIDELIRTKYRLSRVAGWSFIEHNQEGHNQIFSYQKVVSGPTTINNDNDTLDV